MKVIGLIFVDLLIAILDILDEGKNKCVVDICHIYKEKKEKSTSVGLIILIVFICLISIAILGLIIIRIIGRHSKKYGTSLNIN